MDSLKTMESVPDVPADAQPAQFLPLVTLVPIPKETPPTTANVLLAYMMPELINALPAAQAVPHVQAPLPAPLVMPDNSEPSATLFVSAKMDISNLISKMETENAPSAH